MAVLLALLLVQLLCVLFSPSCLSRVLRVTGDIGQKTWLWDTDNFETECLYDVWYALVRLICLMNYHQEILDSCHRFS